MTISIIIPLYREIGLLREVLKHLHSNAITTSIIEIIVCEYETPVDSKDELFAGIKVISSLVKGRSIQMNAGAAKSSGDILYFLHADSFPPHGFDQLILNSIKQGDRAGCFRLKFDHNHWFLVLSAWFSRFNGYLFHGGDQSLFLTRDLFNEIGGYNAKMKIMEDYDLVRKLKRAGQFTILNQPIVTSSKKYETNGFIRLQLIYGYLHLLYALNASQSKLIRLYNEYVR